MRTSFAPTLLTWAATLHRPMPWRGERDAYRIWLSEVILQQTRVAQGEAYYRRFLEAFPAVQDLAAAPADEVMALWQGLGYYSRARNLHEAAKQVVADGGTFPTAYTELLKLPGVGPYSAAAIASFSSGEDVAVVDGNVYRVLARVFGLAEPIDTPAGRRAFRELADELLPRGRSAAYNQAIMDFGAIVCTPRRPRCPECPFRENCSAHAAGTVDERPVKSKKLRRRRRHLEYLHVVREDGSVLLRRRGSGDIWEGLYDLPVVEAAGQRDTNTVHEVHRVHSGDAPAIDQMDQADLIARRLIAEALPALVPHAAFASVTAPTRTQLTHQELILRYWRYSVVAGFGASPTNENAADEAASFRWVSPSELPALGIPQPLKRYLAGGQTGALW